ncbi:substrate-binding domain-containing protein [Maridesulfovibrio sp.]|uniref:substrate-binding domain-containing protein n=1 Tax=Maridesulfovibrio sp. TaxID=2795000 RepID=UPI002AA71920|nr:substrate-binding domain-containing protein [Maridesulfovibrio sp.]
MPLFNCKKKIKISIIFLLLSAVLCISYPANAANTPNSETLSIAVIPERGDLDFWHLLKKGAIKAATDDGKIKILWVNPAGYGSFKEQKKKLKWCMQHQVDAIVISPVHVLRMAEPLEEVIDSGIPVIQMVSKISRSIKTGYVHSDNFKGGALAAEYLQKKLNNSGSVVLGLFTQGNLPVNDRVKGFKDQLDKTDSKLKIAKSIYVGKSYEKGASKIRVAMYGSSGPRKKQKINAVVGFNESSSEVLIETLQKLDKLKGLNFVAFNPDPNMITQIENDTISAGVAQDPFEIGRIAVTQAAMAARGQKIPANTKTGVYLITKDNLSQPKIQEILGLKKRTY